MLPRDLTAIHSPAGAAGQVLSAGIRRPPADPARQVLPAGVRWPPADPARRLLPDPAKRRLPDSVARPSAKLTGHSSPDRIQEPPSIDGQDDREVAAAVTRHAVSARSRFTPAIKQMNWDSIRANPGAAIVTVVLAAWIMAAAVSITLLVFADSHAQTTRPNTGTSSSSPAARPPSPSGTTSPSVSRPSSPSPSVAGLGRVSDPGRRPRSRAGSNTAN
jgi:hypothetical protein